MAQLSGNFALAETPSNEWQESTASPSKANGVATNNVNADVSIALAASGAADAVNDKVVEQSSEEQIDAPGKSVEGSDAGVPIVGTALADRLLGGDGNDVIVGKEGDDLAFGGAGEDEMRGDAGDDELWGGEDNDRMLGGEGDDLLYGEAGDDLIEGDQGHDRLEGGDGDDRLNGGEGSDRMIGGTGDDTIVLDRVTDIAVETDEGIDDGGIDTLEVDAVYAENTKRDLAAFAPGGQVTFSVDKDLGRPLPDEMNAFRHQIDPDIENITLLGDADHDLVGSDEDNVLRGNDGDNVIHGGLGDDALWGQDGEDILYGEDGDDILYGGEGDDIYLLGLAESGTDTIFDHEGKNLVRLDGADPSNLSARLDGSTLVLEQGEAEIVRIEDYTSKPEGFEGVEIDGKVSPLEEFLPKQEPSVPASPQSDLLSEYLDPSSDGPPSAASSEVLELPPKAIVAPEVNTAISEITVDQPAENSDLLASFMNGQEIWTTGEEQPFYAPAGQMAGVGPVDEGQDARA